MKPESDPRRALPAVDRLAREVREHQVEEDQVRMPGIEDVERRAP